MLLMITVSSAQNRVLIMFGSAAMGLQCEQEGAEQGFGVEHLQ